LIIAIEPIRRIKGKKILIIIFTHNLENVIFLMIKYAIKRNMAVKMNPKISVDFIVVFC